MLLHVYTIITSYLIITNHTLDPRLEDEEMNGSVSYEIYRFPESEHVLRGSIVQQLLTLSH